MESKGEVSNMLAAKVFAQEKHKGQKDDDGLDYFTAHVEHVGRILQTVGVDEETLMAAYLHDTIEDCGVTREELEELFGPVVANLVHEVTHEGKKDSKGYYFPRLKTRRAILIKFADRLSNLTRMVNWPPERQAQYLRKSKFWRSE